MKEVFVHFCEQDRKSIESLPGFILVCHVPRYLIIHESEWGRLIYSDTSVVFLADVQRKTKTIDTIVNHE